MPITSTAFVRSTLAFLIAGLIALVVIVVSTVWLGIRNQEYVEDVLRARQVRSAVADLRSLVQQAETAQRGYLLAGEERYLRPYDEVRGRIEPALENLRAMLGADASGPLGELQTAMAAKLEELDRTVALAREGRTEEALAIVRTDVGQAITEQINGLVAGLLQEADERLDQRVEEQEQSAWLQRLVTIAGSVVIIAVVGGSAWTVWRYTRELAAARMEVEALNAGLEEKVRERTVDLGRANEEIQRFAYIVTHDLRAPLVNIMGFTSELEASLGPIQSLVARAETAGDDPDLAAARTVAMEELPEAIGFIRSSTRKMDGLINAILKLSREGRRPLKPERIDLDGLIRATADSVQHQVGEAGGEISFDIRVPTLIGDRLSLEQVFGNLFDNAVKYRRPAVPLRIQVRARPAMANRVEIEFEDNGRGIAEQDHERVFELFRRSGSQDQAGEGIGLAHVRSAIRIMGGEITLKSQLGQGTTFRIILPRNLDAVIRSSAA